MPDVLPTLPAGGSWSRRYSTNQTAMFAPLTRVNRLLPGDLTRPGKLTAPAIPNPRTAPRVTQLTFDCGSTVTNRGQSRQKYVFGGLRGDGGVIASAALVDALSRFQIPGKS